MLSDDVGHACTSVRKRSILLVPWNESFSLIVAVRENSYIPSMIHPSCRPGKSWLTGQTESVDYAVMHIILH